MRKIKIFGLLFFTVFLFLPFTEVRAGTCTRPEDCKVGDFCNWFGANNNACGKLSDYAVCLSANDGTAKTYCTSSLGKTCSVTGVGEAICGTNLVCISSKCTVKVPCSPTKPCPGSLVCSNLSYCVDPASPAAKSAQSLNDTTGSCVNEAEIKCYEVTATGSGNVADIKYKTNPPGINLTTTEAVELDHNKGSISNNLLFVCLFDGSKMPSGVTDSDKYGMCVKSVNTDKTYFYRCVFGLGTAKSGTVQTCNIGAGALNTPPATSATTTSTTSVSSKAELTALSPPACTIDCKVGGFFKNTRKECICCGTCTPDDLLGVANTALEWLFSIVGALGLAMFIYGGFLWITSGGDSSKVEAGRKAMVNTVIGLVIMFASGALILTLQKTLGVQQKVTITGKATTSSSTSSSSTSTGTAKNGTKNLGEACSVLKGNDSECLVGYYCKSATDGGSAGVCIPKNPQATLNPGDTCYYMPLSDANSLCKSGKCNTGKTSPVVGDKGTCPELAVLGGACASNTDCGAAGQCYNKICLPKPGRNKQRFEDCYVLPGLTTNDCDGALRCVPKISTWQYGYDRSAGMAGQCDYIKEIATGAKCQRDFECISLKCDRTVERCVSGGFSYPKTAGQGCVSIKEYETVNTFSDCETGLVCSSSNHVCEAP